MDPKADMLSGADSKFIADLAIASSDAQVIYLKTEGFGPGLPEQVPMLFDRKAQRIVPVLEEIEAARQQPKDIRGTAKAETLEAFIALTRRHLNSQSAIFASTQWPKPSLTAVIDYHEGTLPERDPGEMIAEDHVPRWGDHRIRYEFPVTEEFTAWINGNKKPMEQADFAAFLEEHAAELAAPFDGEVSEYELLFKESFATPADLIALSRSLEVHVGAKVKRAERLQTGERTVEFVEEHLNNKGEKVDIPGIFMVSVPAFIDGDPVRIPARLRYRISGGGIVWFYQLYRWEFWLRIAVKADLREAGKRPACRPSRPRPKPAPAPDAHRRAQVAPATPSAFPRIIRCVSRCRAPPSWPRSPRSRP
jgi:hypothetical protein